LTQPTETKPVDWFLVRHPFLALALPYPLFLLAGFAATRVGVSTWDTVAHEDHMKWLVGMWTGQDSPLPYETMMWIGPLWEYVLAAFCAVLAFLDDPLWVRHAVTLSLLPLTLLATYHLLRRAGETAGTALLAVALIVGNVRFLGHALLNVKDFPFACGYLLVTLLMWTLLRERVGTAEGLFRTPAWLVALVLLSVVPYLLRVPVLSHWLLLVLVCFGVALFGGESVGWRRRGLVALLPLVLGPLVVFAVSPGLWDAGVSGFAFTAGLFSKFPWEGSIRLFGREYFSMALPWWYALVWVPLSWVPVGLVTLVIGGVLFVPRALREAAWLRSPRSQGPPFGSLAVWVALFGATPWFAFLAMQPVLYDEDRHLLFAMPLLAVGAALGLRRAPERVKTALAAVIIVSSVWSAVSWGKHAYVYKNPLLPRSANADFMGDYWGVSTGALAQAAHDNVPDGAYLFLMGPGPTLTRELERREHSLLIRTPEAKSFDLRQKPRRRSPFYVVSINRSGASRPLLDDVDAGRARVLWRDDMPGGDLAAVLVKYETRCEDCPKLLHR
jgi:hypothetical protein